MLNISTVAIFLTLNHFWTLITDTFTAHPLRGVCKFCLFWTSVYIDYWHETTVPKTSCSTFSIILIGWEETSVCNVEWILMVLHHYKYLLRAEPLAVFWWLQKYRIGWILCKANDSSSWFSQKPWKDILLFTHLPSLVNVRCTSPFFY
jgi:hypothetical protein